MVAWSTASAADRRFAFWREQIRRGLSLGCCRKIPPAPSGAEGQCWISLVGSADPLSMDEKMENSGGVLRDAESFITSQSRRVYLTVLLVSAIIYLGCIVSPPSLMDDSDAV